MAAAVRQFPDGVSPDMWDHLQQPIMALMCAGGWMEPLVSQSAMGVFTQSPTTHLSPTIPSHPNPPAPQQHSLTGTGLAHSPRVLAEQRLDEVDGQGGDALKHLLRVVHVPLGDVEEGLLLVLT